MAPFRAETPLSSLRVAVPRTAALPRAYGTTTIERVAVEDLALDFGGFCGLVADRLDLGSILMSVPMCLKAPMNSPDRSRTRFSSGPKAVASYLKFSQSGFSRLQRMSYRRPSYSSCSSLRRVRRSRPLRQASAACDMHPAVRHENGQSPTPAPAASRCSGFDVRSCLAAQYPHQRGRAGLWPGQL